MERVAESLLKSRKLRRLIFATHDEPLVSRLRKVIGPCGIELMFLTEAGLPEPIGLTRGLLHSATRKAAVIAAMTDVPTVGHARGFCIDPLLPWGGGGPQWSWPVPWPYGSEDLAAELKQVHDTLNAAGYCGPADRGAYFRSVLCLAWPDAESQIFEGRLEGQFRTWGFNKPWVSDPARYFVPDSETVALACLTEEVRRRHSDEERAFRAFRRALPT